MIGVAGLNFVFGSASVSSIPTMVAYTCCALRYGMVVVLVAAVVGRIEVAALVAAVMRRRQGCLRLR